LGKFVLFGHPVGHDAFTPPPQARLCDVGLTISEKLEFALYDYDELGCGLASLKYNLILNVFGFLEVIK